MRQNFFPHSSYQELNQLASESQAEGIVVLPFGNGRERMLGNETTNCSIVNIDFNRHSYKNIVRATVEGIAFGFVFGADIVKADGIKIDKIKAGKGNLYECELFCQILSAMINVEIEIYETTGAIGAARGALGLDGKQK